MAADLHLHPWDERYHALVAKHLMSHPLKPTLYDRPVLEYDFKQWSANHIWVHKPPLALWLMAASMKLIGKSEIAVRLPSILFSTTAVAFTYIIGRYFFNTEVALIAAWLHAINGILTTLAAGRFPTDHVDAIFVVLVEAGMLVSILQAKSPKVYWVFLLGIVTGLAVLTKYLTGLFILALFISTQWAMRRDVKAITIEVTSGFVISSLIFIPWEMYIRYWYPQEAAWETQYSWRHLFEVVEGHGGGLLYYVAAMPKYFGEIIFIPIAFFLSFVAKQRSRAMIPLVVWLVVPYVLFSIVSTKMPAYVMIAAPAIFIITAFFFDWLKSKAYHLSGAKRWLSVLVLVGLLALPMRYSLERLKPLSTKSRNPTWARNVRSIAAELQNHGADRVVLFNVENPIELMFYSESTVYPHLPSDADIERVRSRDYNVVIYGHRSEFPQYRNYPDIIFLAHDNK